MYAKETIDLSDHLISFSYVVQFIIMCAIFFKVRSDLCGFAAALPHAGLILYKYGGVVVSQMTSVSQCRNKID